MPNETTPVEPEVVKASIEPEAVEPNTEGEVVEAILQQDYKKAQEAVADAGGDLTVLALLAVVRELRELRELLPMAGRG